MKAKGYKDLKQKQKARISEKMFMSVCDYYRENGRMPENGELEKLAEAVCGKIMGMGYGIPMEEFAGILF